MRRFGLRCGARPLAGWRQMLTLLLAASPATGKNPIVVGKGMADPHIHIFDDTAYLYVGHDRSPEATRFQMVDWNVWTSTDLVNWKHVTTISPNQTYMKDSPTLHPLQRRRVDLREALRLKAKAWVLQRPMAGLPKLMMLHLFFTRPVLPRGRK